MKLVTLSNKRPASAEQGSFLTASQTEGKLRMTGKVATILGVIEGDYVAVATDAETGSTYVFKGMKDDKTQVGNKLASAGQSYEFGSKNVWDELQSKLGSETDGSVKFEVVETPVEEVYYELINPVEIPKQERGKNGSDDEGDEEVEDKAEVVEDEEVADEAEVEASDNFILD